MPVKIVGNNLIYRGAAGTPTANCCFPSIARTAAGTLIVTWRVGSQKDSADGAIWLSRSHDGARTWSSAQVMFSSIAKGGSVVEPHYGSVTALRDGRLLCSVMWVTREHPSLPFYNETTEGILPLRTSFYESRDEGHTWNELGELDAAPYFNPLAITGPVIELPDGAWACPFEVNKHYHDTSPWRHAAAWKISRDGGRTWPEFVEIANDASGRLLFWDMHAVVADEKRCLAAFWVFDREKRIDRTIHLSESRDLGRTWSPPRDSGVVGQVAEPVPLDHNRLLLIVVDRFGTRSIRAMLSHDDGQSYDEGVAIYQQPAGSIDSGQHAVTVDYLQDMELWTFGRVQAVAATAERVFVVYYWGDRRSTGISCANLEL